MTPIEIELLQNLGNSYLESVLILFIGVFFYGVFVVLFSASAIIFMRKGFSNRATAAMFVATAINFLLSTLVTGAEISIFVVAFRKALILDIDYPLSEKLGSVKKVVWNLEIVIDWAGTMISMLLSDLIVIQRAWALFKDQRRVILVPFILWIGVIGMGLACCACSFTRMIGPMALTTSPLINILSITTLTLSIATNGVTTLLIAYKLWSHRMFIMKTLGLRGRTSSGQTILVLLVESGLIYLVIQIGFLVLTLDRSAFNHHAAAFRAGRLSAIYPTVVIVLVETQRSMMDLCPSSANRLKLAGPVASQAKAHAATLGHIPLANHSGPTCCGSQMGRNMSWRDKYGW